MTFLQSLLVRGREPSSYAGLAALLALLGYHLDPGTMQDIVNALMGLSGLAAMVLREYRGPVRP